MKIHPDKLKEIQEKLKTMRTSQEGLAQVAFMVATDQNSIGIDKKQVLQYLPRISREFTEFDREVPYLIKDDGKIDIASLTSLIGITAKTIASLKGLMFSLGVDADKLMWDYWKSELSKIHPEKGEIGIAPDGVSCLPDTYIAFNPANHNILYSQPE